MVFSDYTKRRIQFFHREGLLPSRIQKELEKEGIKSSVVGIWKFLQRSETYGTIERRPGSGRPRKADSTVEAVIEVEMNQDDEKTSQQLQRRLATEGLSLSARTIRRSRSRMGLDMSRQRLLPTNQRCEQGEEALVGARQSRCCTA